MREKKVHVNDHLTLNTLTLATEIQWRGGSFPLCSC